MSLLESLVTFSPLTVLPTAVIFAFSLWHIDPSGHFLKHCGLYCLGNFTGSVKFHLNVRRNYGFTDERNNAPSLFNLNGDLSRMLLVPNILICPKSRQYHLYVSNFCLTDSLSFSRAKTFPSTTGLILFASIARFWKGQQDSCLNVASGHTISLTWVLLPTNKP